MPVNVPYPAWRVQIAVFTIPIMAEFFIFTHPPVKASTPVAVGPTSLQLEHFTREWS
jgi:hypothetical protein